MKVTRDTVIADIVKEHPEVMEVFFKHNLGCAVCHLAGSETIEQGLSVHDKDVDVVIAELNEVIEKKAQPGDSESD